MGSNYTPAPWRIRDAGNGIYDNTDDGVYDVVGSGPYGEITLAEEVDIHDARLMRRRPAILRTLTPFGWQVLAAVALTAAILCLEAAR